jgi:hypothetical protein
MGGLFLLVKGYFIEKQKLAMRLEEEGGSGGRSFEKSAHLSVESPGKMAFPAFAGTSFEHNPGRPPLHASFSRCVMIACALQGRCINPRSNQYSDIGDNSQKKTSTFAHSARLLISGRILQKPS